MDVLVKLTVPNHIYRFYRDASRYIADRSPESVMSDALSAYAVMLSQDIAKESADPAPSGEEFPYK